MNRQPLHGGSWFFYGADMNGTEMKMPLCQAAATPSAAGEKLRLPEQPRAPSGAKLTNEVRSFEELRAFVNKHHVEIVQKAKALTFGTNGNPEEIVQELFPRLKIALDRSPNGFNNAWGMTHAIMARLAIDQYRTLKRTRERIKRLEFPDSIPDHHHKRDLYGTDAEALSNALDTLPQRLKKIVVGIFLEGCKAKDIAKTLGLSESRLAELKALALRQLREVLK
jgi:RNA polymerase sigma factor (sigma-70 family)